MVARPHAARPQQNVEIKRACAPFLAPDAPAEMGFYGLESSEHCGRGERARNDCRAIGILPLRRANSIAGDYRCNGEHIDIVHLERTGRLGEYATWRADDGVALVRSQCDQIDILQIKCPRQAAHRVRGGGPGRSP